MRKVVFLTGQRHVYEQYQGDSRLLLTTVDQTTVLPDYGGSKDSTKFK